MLSINEIKQRAGTHAAELVQTNTVIGVGTGSTAYWFIMALAERIKQGLVCRAVPTSNQSKLLAEQSGIPLVTLNEVDSIALTVDGADEIDHQLQVIKGGGAALLQEKMVAAASQQLIIIGDHTKYVSQLGAFPLPVEVIPYGWKQVQKHIQQLPCSKTALRMKDDKPLVTDHGHYILDCFFERIADAPALATTLNMIPGVVDNGLFINLATSAIISYPDGRLETITKK